MLDSVSDLNEIDGDPLCLVPSVFEEEEDAATQ
jgi:hypothetical protein